MLYLRAILAAFFLTVMRHWFPLRIFKALLSLVLVLLVASQIAYSQDSPAWVPLESETLKFPKEDVFKASFKSPIELLKHYRPAGAEIEGLKLEEKGPQSLPRLNFFAKSIEVSVGFITVSVNVNAAIRADTSIKPVKCTIDVTDTDTGSVRKVPSPGYRMEISFKDSDGKVSRNVSEFAMNFCILNRDRDTGEVEVSVQSFLKPTEKNPSGRIYEGAKELMGNQTEAFIDALNKRYGAVAYSAQLQDDLDKARRYVEADGAAESWDAAMEEFNKSYRDASRLVQVVVNDTEKQAYFRKLKELTDYCKQTKNCPGMDEEATPSK